ncbi:PH domain-containing protein [Candidatus Saccharibacteria bacterium]|jgi:hypothetical protein|nr:PH domain-containing protein [Candidatus Saccharibacteria bacterium]
MDESLVKIRHARSKKDFPSLKLEDDEYVEFAFRRSRLCLMAIFGGVAAGLVVILLAFLIVLLGQNSLDEMGRNFMYIILTCLVVAAMLIGLVALIVYRGNRMIITNKHVIQMVMKSPVATSVNIIDLQSIEDASFHQSGLLQKLFRYGTLRLSTIGDETTYTFPYSDVSPSELKAISKLITEAKAEKEAK